MSKHKDKDPFFIGWSADTPKESSKVVKQFILLLIPFLVLAAFLFNTGKQTAENALANYEFGQLTTMEGVLVNKPVPMLRVKQGDTIQHLLLLDAMKFGATQTIQDMEEKANTTLINKVVQLKGTLAFFEGKTTLELTEGANAFVGLGTSSPIASISMNSLGTKKLRGEILDSKCFFGVMKPGSGKIHKSCAVRCLSGGVPAIFRSNNSKGNKEYYLLLGENGESINKDLLGYTADHIQLQGKISQMADWKIIHTSPSTICPLGPKWLFGDMPLCAD